MNSAFVIGVGPRQSLTQLPMWPTTHFPKSPKRLSVPRSYMNSCQQFVNDSPARDGERAAFDFVDLRVGIIGRAN